MEVTHKFYLELDILVKEFGEEVSQLKKKVDFFDIEFNNLKIEACFLKAKLEKVILNVMQILEKKNVRYVKRTSIISQSFIICG